MGNRVINRTQAEVGGLDEMPHGKDCPRACCNDLERVYLDEVDEAVGPAGRIHV